MPLPSWTKQSSIEEAGRDPLGLERVHDRLSEWLSPGITLVTPRARYYTFYLWAIQQTNLMDDPRDRGAFIEGLRRREAAFIVANLADAEQTGAETETLTGTEQGLIKWHDGQETGRYSTKFDPLPSNRLGGYGQYYSGSLYKLGLLHIPPEAKGIDQLTDAGVALADAFDHSIQSTKYRRKYQRDVMLDVSVLSEYGEYGGLDRLDGKRQECQVLADLFLGQGQYDKPGADWRRQSVLLCLDVARATEVAGYPFDWQRRENVILDCAVYYRNLAESGKPVDYDPPPAIADCCARYRIFHANRYFIFALENLLTAFIYTLQSNPAGMTVDEYVDSLDWSEVERAFSSDAQTQRIAGASLSRWLLAVYKQPALLDINASRRYDQESRSGKKAVENEAVSAMLGANVTERVGLSIAVFLSLFCRWYHYRTEGSIAWIDVEKHSQGDLWVNDIMRAIEEHLDRDASVKDFLRYILAQWVVRQHEKVLIQKNKPGAGWLVQGQNHRITYKQYYQGYWRSSRLVNVTRILRDIGLLDVKDDCLQLTREGRRVLSKELTRAR